MTAGLPLSWRLRALALVLLVPPLVYIVSFARLVTWLGDSDDAAPDTSLDDATLARWVDRWLRRLPGPWRHTCLKRAAVLYSLLRQAGRPVELCIGVNRDGTPGKAEIAAHAWLMRGGEPYLESHPEHASRHVVIARFPEAPVPAVPR